MSIGTPGCSPGPCRMFTRPVRPAGGGGTDPPVSAGRLAAVINTAGLLFITQPELGKSNGEFISATFGAPLVEETLKGTVLFWLLWRRRPEFDGPTDGIMYAAMVGLGFAMTENIGYYISALVRPQIGGAE